MSEAVKVVVKCRPMNRREKDLECKHVLEIDSSSGQCFVTNVKDREAPPKTFTFDGAYGGDATNEQVYLDIAFPLVEGVTEGYNGTVFAYGQTGGGKTFTMQGVTEPTTQRGLIPRAFDHIFETVAVAVQTRYLIHASFLEIYNEEVRDLLGEDTKARLELRERPDSEVFVKDLSLHPVANVRTCEQIMNKGWKNRATASTMMNSISSRSHSVFTIHLERCDDPDKGSKIRASKLNLVDLAGSERQSKSGAIGDRLKEATKINLSLSALGNVISALVDGRSVHIPYRDSKLTRLLQDSLGGNTKTLMIACVSPANYNYDETLSTLRYANRAKNIKNKPRINEDPKDALIRQYLDEINRLKAMLIKAPPPRYELIRPATPEPQIIEKIVHVSDEEEIRYKTQQIALEYEIKMQKMTAELAEAQASSERTAAEMDRLKTEADAKQRQLYAEITSRAQSERDQLKQQFVAEMERVQQELTSTRQSKDLVQTEMESMRRQYESAMFSVENSVSPQELVAERERLRAEYETNMKVMRDELEAVKMSRANTELEMENLKVEYETRLSAESLAKMDADSSASAALLSFESDGDLRQKNLTDEMKIVSADSFNRHQTEGRISRTPENSSVEELQSESDVVSAVHSRLVKDSLSKYSTSEHSIVHHEEPLAIDVEQTQRDAASNHENIVSMIKTELEDFKQSRDNLANVIYRIKMEYQHEVETVHSHNFDLEKLEIKSKYQIQMDRVKDDLQVLKSHWEVVNLQLVQQTSAWKNYEEERQKIREDVEAGKVERRLVPALIKTATDRYLHETRRLSDVASTDKKNAELTVVNERFEREKQRIDDDIESGKLTEAEADVRIHELIRTKTVERTAIHERPNKPMLTVAEDLSPKNATKDAQSSEREAEAGDTMALRLKTLEDILIQGGRGITGEGTSPDMEHCRVIREKLRREKQNAEEKQRKVQEAHTTTKANAETNVTSALYDVFASAHDEIMVKTTALAQLRAQNENLQHEISDIQAEFEFDRIDYLDTIRKQDQTLKWYQTVVEQILPALRRDSNYADLDRVRAQSEWDDLNQKWKVPKFSVEKKFSLPPATFPGRSSASSTSPTVTSSFSGDLDFELRSEQRLIKKLNESSMRDPAAAYFRSRTRVASATVGHTQSPLPTVGRISNNRLQDSTTPTPTSPLLERRRHLV